MDVGRYRYGNDINFRASIWLLPTDEQGFNLVIRGIRANASMVGDGEDIMATVLVGGTAVTQYSAQSRGRDNRTGGQGRRSRGSPVCRDTDARKPTITIQEGFWTRSWRWMVNPNSDSLW